MSEELVQTIFQEREKGKGRFDTFSKNQYVLKMRENITVWKAS